MIPKNRMPTHPGEILKEEFLDPMGLRQREIAERMNVTEQRINELVNGKRGVTPETAILLSRVLGTTAEFWMNLQTAFDLAKAEKKLLHT
ncbi:MAG: HigA family addiction module antitoxin [Candidatus Omnitrophota bacterium]